MEPYMVMTKNPVDMAISDAREVTFILWLFLSPAIGICVTCGSSSIGELADETQVGDVQADEGSGEETVLFVEVEHLDQGQQDQDNARYDIDP